GPPRCRARRSVARCCGLIPRDSTTYARYRGARRLLPPRACASGGATLLTRRLVPAAMMLGIAVIVVSCAEPIAGPAGLGGVPSDTHVTLYARVPDPPFAPHTA